jgi:hypothetical protein
MLTAQKMKSTCAATSSTLEASCTIIPLTLSGIGVVMAQRLPTASSYVLPALRPEAARTVSLNQGWFSSSVIKR